MKITLAEDLRCLREARGWDLFSLSRASGIGITTLAAYEGGRMPTLCNLARLAKALGVSLGRFDEVVIPSDARHRIDRKVLQAVS
jgi:transcriptional regulator with XRE-family HTH domain